MDTGAIAELSIPITITLGAFIMIVYLRKFKNIERMAMIDKGLSPDLFKGAGTTVTPLRWSLLLIGCGLGLLFGHFLDYAFDMKEVAYFSMVFIFGGAGLGLAYIIESKKSTK
ncbi:MAG: DUF6249 domain-containing protein [Flammeovirgaceae bacterium]